MTMSKTVPCSFPLQPLCPSVFHISVKGNSILPNTQANNSGVKLDFCLSVSLSPKSKSCQHCLKHEFVIPPFSLPPTTTLVQDTSILLELPQSLLSCLPACNSELPLPLQIISMEQREMIPSLLCSTPPRAQILSYDLGGS